MKYLIFQDNNEFKYCYKIANSLYKSDTQITELDYLHQANNDIKDTNKPNTNRTNVSFNSSKSIYNQITLIGENNYPLHVQINESGHYQIKIDSDLFQINHNEIKASISNIDITVLMGPVFILHLAKNHIFCLHASAFIINDICFILMANSGTGKSTIARYMQQKKLGLRIADDIVPLISSNESLTILPNFPQLKLNQDQQYFGENICKKTVLLFGKKSLKETSLSKINKFVALKKLITHSVATKLFAENELNNHLRFCHQTSTQANAYKLNYQHSLDSLKQLWELINDIS